MVQINQTILLSLRNKPNNSPKSLRQRKFYAPTFEIPRILLYKYNSKVNLPEENMRVFGLSRKIDNCNCFVIAS